MFKELDCENVFLIHVLPKSINKKHKTPKKVQSKTNCVLDQVTKFLPGQRHTDVPVEKAKQKTPSVIIIVSVKGVPTGLRVGVTCTD